MEEVKWLYHTRTSADFTTSGGRQLALLRQDVSWNYYTWRTSVGITTPGGRQLALLQLALLHQDVRWFYHNWWWPIHVATGITTKAYSDLFRAGLIWFLSCVHSHVIWIHSMLIFTRWSILYINIYIGQKIYLKNK